MNDDLKIKRLFTSSECGQCAELKERLAKAGKLTAIEVIECNVNGSDDELQNCLKALEEGVILFPTVETEDEEFCVITGEDEEGNLTVECGENKTYPKIVEEVLEAERDGER